MSEQINRRAFFRCSAGFVAATGCALPLRGQDPIAENRPKRQIRMSSLAQIPDSIALATSPDGSGICVDYTKNQIAAILPRSTGNTFAYDRLRIIETSSQKEVASAGVQAWLARASFFSDSHRAYFETVLLAPSFRQFKRGVISISGEVQESTATWVNGGPNITFEALSDEALLGVESNGNSEATALTLASWPDYREVARIPFRPAGGEVRPQSFPRVSADCKAVLYVSGHTICVRQTSDLSLIWSRKIDSGLFGAGPISITPSGTFAAVSVLDYERAQGKDRHYIGVYDGADGSEVAVLPVSGKGGMAISPDGKHVAVALVSTEDRDTLLVVDIYEVRTGLKVASGVHDRIPPGRYQRLRAAFDPRGLQFTPDGRYLVTSGNISVKIWAFD